MYPEIVIQNEFSATMLFNEKDNALARKVVQVYKYLAKHENISKIISFKQLKSSGIYFIEFSAKTPRQVELVCRTIDVIAQKIKRHTTSTLRGPPSLKGAP